MLYQIIRFVAVGAVAFIIDYSILYILTDIFSIYYLISAALAFTISTIFNYIFSMIWVFKGRKNISKKNELIMFVLLSIIGLVINQVIMFILVEIISFYYMFAKIVATLIVMVWNFITRKYLLEEHN